MLNRTQLNNGSVPADKNWLLPTVTRDESGRL